MEVRSIITEALSRSNVVPRRQPAPGDLMLSAYNLLQGIVGKFNNDNFLAFTQMGLSLPSKQLIHIYGKDNTMLGDNNLVFDSGDQLSGYELTEQDYENSVWGFINDGQHDTVIYSVLRIGTELGPIYQWQPHPNQDGFNPRYQQILQYAKAYHVHVDGVSKLNTLYVDRAQPYGMLKLNFVPHADFDGYANSDLLWTFKELAQGEWIIRTKPYLASSATKFKLDYNKAVEFDLDTDLRIPDAYVELLTVALTYKLAVAYPRMDDAQLVRLKDELGTMINNVKVPKADTKQVLRDDGYDDRSSYFGVIGGRMWGV